MPASIDDHHPPTGDKTRQQIVLISLERAITDHLGVCLLAALDRIVNHNPMGAVTRDATHNAASDIFRPIGQGKLISSPGIVIQ